jgi:DNA invertase Pin-like site-specific DNA recombinase
VPCFDPLRPLQTREGPLERRTSVQSPEDWSPLGASRGAVSDWSPLESGRTGPTESPFIFVFRLHGLVLTRKVDPMRTKSRNESAAIIYCRVSAVESQSESDASLEQQERTLRAMAEAAGFTEVIAVIERHTASKSQPELERSLDMLAAGDAVALFAAKIDRLSRKGAADVLRIADRAEREDWRLIVADVSLDTGTTVGRLVLTILAGVAEMESRRRSERMREYHAARRARGEVPGQTYGMTTTASADTITEIMAGRSAGMSWQALTDALNARNADGRRWHPTAVRRVHGSPAAADMLAA